MLFQIKKDTLMIGHCTALAVIATKTILPVVSGTCCVDHGNAINGTHVEHNCMRWHDTSANMSGATQIKERGAAEKNMI